MFHYVPAAVPGLGSDHGTPRLEWASLGGDSSPVSLSGEKSKAGTLQTEARGRLAFVSAVSLQLLPEPFTGVNLHCE